jgi:hypothetical protein
MMTLSPEERDRRTTNPENQKKRGVSQVETEAPPVTDAEESSGDNAGLQFGLKGAAKKNKG